MTKFIDCHAHLCAKEFKNDVDDVISRAKESGVLAVLVVAENKEEFNAVLELSNRYPNFCYSACGVHPVQTSADEQERSVSEKDIDEATLSFIELHQDKLVAIGEVGLDFTPRFCLNNNDKDNQRTALRKQAELALRLDLPLNVHSRSAGKPTIALLKEVGCKNVLLHAFDGNVAAAMEGVRLGYYFSVPPCTIRSEQKQKIFTQIPLENIVLETDSPVLGPEKQVRNEPKNIKISLNELAKLKKMSEEDLIEICQKNSLKLFPRMKSCLNN